MEYLWEECREEMKGFSCRIISPETGGTVGVLVGGVEGGDEGVLL